MTLLREHPLIVYLVLILPVLLLGAAMLLNASLFLILLILVWIGASFIILFLPVSADSGST